MKSILMSIQPQWCAKILNGEKTIEIRKRFPIDYIGWVYVYVTKPKRRYRIEHMGFFSDELYKTPKGKIKFGSSVELMAYDDYDKNNFLSGKVVARFWCDEITKIKYGRWVGQDTFNYYGYHNEWKDLVDKSMMTQMELYNYGSKLLAISITRLEIFDTPKELKEFNVWRKKTIYSGMDCPPYVDDIKVPLTRAPHNWCWVE